MSENFYPEKQANFKNIQIQNASLTSVSITQTEISYC